MPKPTKGVTHNPHGKPKNALSKKRKEWDALMGAIAGKHAARFNRILTAMDDETFAKTYLQILKYFRPQQPLQTININGVSGDTSNIQVINFIKSPYEQVEENNAEQVQQGGAEAAQATDDH